MFDVTPEDIGLLTDKDLRELVGRLCEAEAGGRGFSTSNVMYGGDQNAGDEGLDVHVSLPQNTAIEGYIPRSETGFQVKKTKMPGGEIRKEMRPSGSVRPAIEELANHAGAYIIASSEATSRRMLRERLNAMRDAVKDVANNGSLKLDFYDRTRLAAWVRCYGGLVPWVREKIGKAIPGWRPYGPWAYAAEGVEGEYLLDDGFRIRTGKKDDGQGLAAEKGLEHLRAFLSQPRNVARLVGLSGVGKTRFLQALFDARIGKNSLDPALAIYTNTADDPDPVPSALATDLVAAGKRQILLIDNCASDIHRRLSDICRSQASKLSLVTVEYDVRDDQPEATEVFRLEPSSDALIQRLIRSRFPALSVVDARTIAEHSGGNARIAIAIAGTIGENETVSGLTDDELFRRLFHQGREEDGALLLAAEGMALVYSFQGEDVSAGDDAELVRLGAIVGKDSQEMFRHAAELYRRDLIQKRGMYRAVLPHALANHLARRALENVPFSVIEGQLVNGAPARLLRSFARRLGYLSDSEAAIKIGEAWLAPGGLLGDARNLNELGKAMFENIAPVAPEAALSAIERAFTEEDAGQNLSRYGHLIRLLRQLAYDAERFDRCLALIAKFAAADVKEARDIFPSFFYLYLSGTHAPLEQRQAFLRGLLASDNPKVRKLGVEGLKESVEAWHFNSANSFEFGARSRDPGYWPSTMAEVKIWYAAALKFAGDVAASDMPCAAEVRAAVATQLRGLWTAGRLFDEVEQVCEAIAKQHFWREGWVAIREIQSYDAKGFSSEVLSRLALLEQRLRPTGLVQKVRAVVLSQHSHDVGDFEGDVSGDIHERVAKTNATVRDVGRKVAADEIAFGELVGALFDWNANNQHLWTFGTGLAEGAADPCAIWKRLRLQLATKPEEQRNITVLRGFLQGLQARNSGLTNDLLDEAVEDDLLGYHYPSLETAVTIDKRGVDRLMRALDIQKAPIGNYEFLAWGRASDPISSEDLKVLVLRIAGLPAGFDVAAEILHMRLHSEKDWKGGFSQETIDAGRQLMNQLVLAGRNDREDYRLGEIAKACFSGPEGVTPVLELCQRLKNAVYCHDTHPYHHDDLLVSLFNVQPRACLDGLCAGDATELERGMTILDEVHRFKAGLLDVVPESVLLGWCDEEPGTRYAAVAGRIAFTTNTEDARPREWTKLALGLLEKAPDRVAVLRAFISEFRGPGGWGSPVAIFEANTKLLDKLEQHPDATLRAFVAQEKARLAREIEREKRLEKADERSRSGSFE